MERKLKILKAVLLLRKVNRYHSKEEQIEYSEKYYTDQELDAWIEVLKNPEEDETFEEYMEFEEYPEFEEEEMFYTSCTYGDYSPSSPWNAPGMSVRDFICTYR